MDLFVILLRILHIASGIFWVGSAWFFFGFLEPTANALGPDAQKFMHHMIARRRVAKVILAVSTLNVAAGVILYWRISSGLDPSWMFGTGIGFTVGAAAAIIAWLVGLLGISRNVERLDALGSAMASAGRPPTPDELARFGAVSHTLHRLGQVDVTLLSIAVIGMAVGRYLG